MQFLVSTGEWIAVNIFRASSDDVGIVAAISTTPYALIGGIALVLVSLVIIGLFIVLVGV